MNEAKQPDDGHHWIDADDDLARLCGQWRKAPRLAVDTEFVRTRTFHAQLGLIQVGVDGECFLVDPLAAQDLQPLLKLLIEGAPLKLIHSGSEDLEIFVRLGGHAPRPLFDTQVAAALCGLGPSLSYQALVREVCGVEISKAEVRSNWLKRPLSESQLRYARLDVTHLDAIHDHLSERLQALGRQSWMDEEMDRVVTHAETIDGAEDQFQRFKGAWKLDPIGIEVLWGLVQWRESEAQRRDRPRNFVIEPDVMTTLARERPRSRRELDPLIEGARGGLHRDANRLLALIAACAAVPTGDRRPPPPPPLDIATKSLMKSLRRAVQDAANKVGLEPELLATKRDLTELIRTDRLPERLSGWRRAVVGDALMDIMENEA